MKMISIYTFTMGRELYLQRLINSINELGGNKYPLEHVICYQGTKPSVETLKMQESRPYMRIVQWKENCGIAEGINRVVPELEGEIICKFDDDCILRSPDFFDHTRAINDIDSNLVFSPYPVGLINNPGGVLSTNRSVKYSESNDTYYTFRFVNHVGGFARIAPAHIIKDWVLEKDLMHGASGNEDAQCSNKCQQLGIKMAYLENALIVEHQESTMGQHARYDDSYFKGRF